MPRLLPSELTSQLNDLTGRVDSAREAVDTLIDKTVNGFDIGTQTINITNLTKLTGQGTINGSGNGQRQRVRQGNINGTVELVPSPEPTEKPEETPGPTETPAVTEAPTAAPDPDPTAAPAPEPDQPDDQPAEQSEDDREGEAHGRPRRNEPLLMWISILAGKAAVTLAAMRPSTMAAKARSTATLT